MKRGTPDHPKLRGLARMLGLETWGAVGILESLWHFTARFAPRGDIGRYSDEDIALGIDYRGRVDELMCALTQLRWIDACAVNRYVVHDWAEHADESVKKLILRNGWEFAKVETRRNKVSTRRKKVCLPEPEPEPKPEPYTSLPGFVDFWSVYPKKQNKQDALVEWKKLDPDDALATRIVADVRRRCGTDEWQKENGKYVPHPRTYLRKRRWEDEDDADSAARLLAPRPNPNQLSRELREREWREDARRAERSRGEDLRERGAQDAPNRETGGGDPVAQVPWTGVGGPDNEGPRGEPADLDRTGGSIAGLSPLSRVGIVQSLLHRRQAGGGRDQG